MIVIAFPRGSSPVSHRFVRPDNLANVGNAVVVIMLYVFVLKSLMLSLRGTARRTEYMLLGFPEDFAAEGPLKRFFMRTNDLAVSA